MKALDLDGSDAYCSATPESWAEVLASQRRDDVDGYILSCANISCFSVIGRMERELGKPLITSNQAVLWAMLRAADASRPRDLGALMDVA